MTRSNRDGRPRIYVFAEGQRLGWLDLNTGEQLVTHSEDAADFGTPVADYLATHPKARPTPRSCRDAGDAVQGSAGGPVVPRTRHAHWDDLADTAPGANLQTKVAELSAAARVDYPEEATPWLVGAEGEVITAEALARWPGMAGT